MDMLSTIDLENMVNSWRPSKADVNWVRELLNNFRIGKYGPIIKWRGTFGEVELDINHQTVKPTILDINDGDTVMRILLVLSKLGWKVIKNEFLIFNARIGKPCFIPS